MNRDIDALFASLDPKKLSVIEVSGCDRSNYPWASYTRTEYPEFDLCDPSATHNGRYDLVICEQVLEHVENPVTAVRNLKALCAPDGMLLVSTPFLIRIHPTPQDFWRFTPEGLKKLLECQGLRVEWVHSWGNRAVVRRNFRVWARYRPWQSLKNEPNFPVMVWALAHVADAPEA
jgi:SAM-dependent methyltransferase